MREWSGYSRCFKADSAHPIGSSASVTRHVVLAARFANALATRLAEGAAVHDASESRPAAGAAPALAPGGALLLLGTRLATIDRSDRLLIRLLLAFALERPLFPQELQFRLESAR